MLLKEILHDKGGQVHAIGPQATLKDAVAQLVRHNIGSLIVRQGEDLSGSVLGIITERDILRAQACQTQPLDQLRVATVMSVDLVTAEPDSDLGRAMWLMTTRRVRHLPVISAGELLGIVSIGDIVKAHHDRLELENHHMRSYIQGDRPELAAPEG
jgi:CBS domain-containing protein